MGGGVGLAAASDLVLASPRASFALPETLMGLIPAMIFPYVARRIGVSHARLLALGSRPLTAAAALEYGMVDEVADDLPALLLRHAKRFAKMDRRAIAEIKTLIAVHFPPPQGYVVEAASRFSHQTRARIASFMEGNPPWEASSA
jgi:enoyl-CoA hydratase/carnithine racemase